MIRLMSRVIFAGPTTGKSALVSLLSERGYDVCDTDTIVADTFPRYYKERLWKLTPSAEARPMFDMVRALCGRISYDFLAKRPDTGVVVSNLWGPEFRNIVFGRKPDDTTKDPVVFFRADPEEMVKLDKLRHGGASGGFTLKIATRWADQQKKWGLSNFKTVVWISTGTYLSAYLEMGYGPLKGQNLDVLVRKKLNVTTPEGKA